MKPQIIKNSNQNYTSKTKRNLNQNIAQPANLPKEKNVSFGGLGSSAKNIATDAMKWIDNSNFFVEFLIVDTLSLVLPRILIGLGRDKDKTGKYNLKAAKEEAGREILSGPSLNLIPMGVLMAAAFAKPASHIDRGTIVGLTDNMKQVISTSNPKTLTDKKAINQQMADKLFDEAFGTNFSDKSKIKAYKKQFQAALIRSTEEKPLSLLDKVLRKPKLYEEAQKEFSALVCDINNAGKIPPISEESLKVGGGGISASELFDDLHKYSKDIIEKFVKHGSEASLQQTPGDKFKKVMAALCDKVTAKSKETTNATKNNSIEFIEKLAKNRLLLKTGTAITAFFAVGSFLLYLPRLYQQKGLSPAQESARRAAEAAKGGTYENK